jgi:adenylosuccinate lyase
MGDNLISRYTSKRINSIFSPINRLRLFVEIERLFCSSQGCPDHILDDFSKVDLERLDKDLKEREKETHHETVAFIQALGLQMSEESLPYLHKGATSSDILDTCLAKQMKDACEIIISDIEILLDTLKCKALEHKYTPILGRSHGMSGEITSFGMILLGFYSEWLRNLDRLKRARDEISFGKMSGAMGNYVHIDPEIEKTICKALGLDFEPVSTQVIPRDRHAYFMSVLGIIGSSIERLSVEVRNLSQSLIQEVAEGFGKDQTGSSAMPHKRNPILSENLTGLSRMIRSYVQPSLENVSLWYERDMSHSSVERIALEDCLHLVSFGLNRLNKVIDNLYINVERMSENITSMGGSYLSQTFLLFLMNKGYPRDLAYKVVQEMTLYGSKNFLSVLYEAQEAGHLTKSELDDILSTDRFFTHIDQVFSRFQ